MSNTPHDGARLRLLHAIRRLASRVYRSVRTRLSPTMKVKCSRTHLSVWTRNGGLHVIPTPGKLKPISFKVSSEHELYAVADGGTLVLASFGTDEEAHRALAKLTSALNASVIFKWVTRGILAWFLYLFAMNYAQVLEQQRAQMGGNELSQAEPPQTWRADPAYQDVPTAQPMATGSPAAAVPAEASSDLAGYIMSQAVAAGQQVENQQRLPENIPPDEGLGSFGLNTAPEDGPGCDPALAFKVPGG